MVWSCNFVCVVLVGLEVKVAMLLSNFVCMTLIGLEVKVDGMVMLPSVYGTCWVGG